jgi:hypothetical protein
MAALLDIDLEQVAQVIQRRRGLAEMALLLDRGSVSPWITIRRRSMARCSPGTSCQAGLP